MLRSRVARVYFGLPGKRGVRGQEKRKKKETKCMEKKQVVKKKKIGGGQGFEQIENLGIKARAPKKNGHDRVGKSRRKGRQLGLLSGKESVSKQRPTENGTLMIHKRDDVGGGNLQSDEAKKRNGASMASANCTNSFGGGGRQVQNWRRAVEASGGLKKNKAGKKRAPYFWVTSRKKKGGRNQKCGGRAKKKKPASGGKGKTPGRGFVLGPGKKTVGLWGGGGPDNKGTRNQWRDLGGGEISLRLKKGKKCAHHSIWGLGVPQGGRGGGAVDKL